MKRKRKALSRTDIDANLSLLIGRLGLSRKITVDDIKNVIYHEADKKGSLKLLSGFMPYTKDKASGDLLLSVIQDAWNHLPHQSLGGASPDEVYAWYYSRHSKGKKPTHLDPQYSSSKTSIYQLFEDELPSETTIVSGGGEEYDFLPSARYFEMEHHYEQLVAEEMTTDAHRIRDLEDLIKKEPLLFPAISNLAALYWRTGKERQARQLYEYTISAVKRLLPDAFDESKHHMSWGILENRPYLSFLLDYAGFVEATDGARASTTQYERILCLNPNDNQGVRMILSTLYLKTGRNNDVLALAAQYPDDVSPEIVMGKTLVLFRLGREQEATTWLTGRRACIEHCIQELVQSTHEAPVGYDEERVTVGGGDEAYAYWLEQGYLWQATLGAVVWLRRMVDARLEDVPAITDFLKRGAWIPRLQILSLYLARKPIYDEGQTLIFRVKLLHDKRTYRDIELVAIATFADFHRAIIDAYGFDDDHLYEFFLDHRRWSPEATILSPKAQKNVEQQLFANDVTISRLRIVPRMKFLYVFDFGDEWWFEIEFRSVGEKNSKKHYPCLLVSRGKSPEGSSH